METILDKDQIKGVVTDGVTIIGDGTVLNPLSAGGSGTSLQKLITQANAFTAGQVIRMDSTGNYVLAQADTAPHSEAVGIVISATGTDFTYVSSAIKLPYTNAFTPGDGLFLDPSVAGGITNVKPTTVGQVIRAVGTCLDTSNIYFDIAALAEEITAGGSGALGSWVSRSGNTIYQAATDLLIVAWGYPTAGGTLVGFTFNIVTDSNATPTTVRVDASHSGNIGVRGSITCPVKAGDYYKVNVHTTGPLPSDDYAEIWEIAMN